MGRKPLRVLVISPETSVEDLLRRELSPADFETSRLAPGGALVTALRGVRPDIAVIDRAHALKDAVPMEVALLRDVRPGIRIIALSREASLDDADLVEPGLFYLLQATLPLRLPELVRAAARSLDLRERAGSAVAR